MTTEVFRWERARYIYDEARRNGKSGLMAVYKWARDQCGANHEQAWEVSAQCESTHDDQANKLI